MDCLRARKELIDRESADISMTVSATSLPARFRAVEQRKLAKAALLTVPLFAFLAVFFFLPIASILGYSVKAPQVPRTFPRTSAQLANWDGTALPDEATYAALLADLIDAYANQTVTEAATRLNHEISGFRRIVLRTARRADKLDDTSPKKSLIAFNASWGDLSFWRAMRSASKPYTLRYVLEAVDLAETWDGNIVPAPAKHRVYIHLLLQTLWISVVVTLLSLACSYPVAYFMATASGRWSGLLLILVLLPFWISVLVRTAAWIVVLQKKGILNKVLLSLGVIAEPLELIFNRFAVYVAMVYVLLPFMVLPLYSVMKSIKPDQLRAAESLGATPLSAFLSVYLPQTAPGVAAGCLLVFIQAVGFYVTPALVGGRKDQMISMVIANYALDLANWNMAAALSIVLLVCVALLYPLCARFVSVSAVKMS
jgi:putative spermidine/putrescine transport system permease protein